MEKEEDAAAEEEAAEAESPIQVVAAVFSLFCFVKFVNDWACI